MERGYAWTNSLYLAGKFYGNYNKIYMYVVNMPVSLMVYSMLLQQQLGLCNKPFNFVLLSVILYITIMNNNEIFINIFANSLVILFILLWT